MKNKIKKYKFHIFAFAVTLGIAIMSRCGQEPLQKQLGCPCRIKEKKMTETGGILKVINKDSLEKRVINKEWYEKYSTGDTIN